jgi:hypothetical protein
MGQTTDQLRQEVDQKREDAALKIDQIQAKVEGATQQVKDTFDLRKQIEENPLLALGAALAGGFVLGGILGDRDERHYPHDDQSQRVPSYRAQSSSGIVDTVRKAAKSSGIEETLNTMVTSFMGALGERVKAIGEESFPGLMPRHQDGGDPQGAAESATSGSSSHGGPNRPSAAGTATVSRGEDASASAVR